MARSYYGRVVRPCDAIVVIPAHTGIEVSESISREGTPP
jgi:hypothetical protein